MDAKYPNLELLEYKVRQLLSKEEVFVNTMEKQKNRNSYAKIEFDVTMFSQIWGSTCTGFDVTSGGESVLSGCAMTKEYTTVFHELLTDSYVVCFGDRPCYMVSDAPDSFFHDFSEKHMASLSKAKKRY